MVIKKTLLARLLFIFLSVSSCLWALDPDTPINGYNIQVWNRESGLPSNSVYAIQQTRDGYLWVGTQDGLARFDGVHFQMYSHTGGGRLESDVIRVLYEDKKDTLWIGTEHQGLIRYQKGEFFTYPVTTYPNLADIRAIHRDRWGNLWIGSFSQGLTCFNNGRFTTYTTRNGLPHNQVRAISVESNGDLRVVTASSIIKVLKPGVFEPCDPKFLLPELKTTCLYREAEAELWVGTGAKGLFCLDPSGLRTYGIKEGLPHLTITTLYEDRRKNLWIGTDGGGLNRMSNGKLSALAMAGNLAGRSILSIYEDREGCLWVGTLTSGLYQLRDSIFTTYSTKEGLSHNHAGCIYEDHDGDILIGTKGGLNRMHQGLFTIPLTVKEGLLNNDISSLFEDASGTLWIGTWGGLHTLKNKTLATLTQQNGLSDSRITSIVGDKQGNIWVGTANGLNQIDGQTHAITHFSTADGLAGNNIQFLFVESNQSLLIDTGAGLNRLKDGTIRPFTLDGRTNISLVSVYQDNEGRSWWGTNIGLIRLDGEHSTLYSIQNGLVENHIYSIVEDDNGYLWLSGRRGISRVSKLELAAVAEGRGRDLYPDWYNEKDGMKSEWSTGAAFKTRDGKLWFPTLAGVVVFDPNRIQRRTPPSPIIERLVVDGNTIYIDPFTKKKNTFKLEPGKKRVEFSYSAISFFSPEKITFKIKLDGYDNDWIDMSNSRLATYTGLRPGDYTFRVRSGRGGGIWNEHEDSFSFYLRPYFYQTTLFYLLLLLFFVLVFYSLHLYNNRQLRARKKELKRLVAFRTRDLEERNRELDTARENILHSKQLIEAKNQKLEEQSEQLKELDRAKTSFFANISHEFRTPLTLINGPLEQIIAANPDKNLQAKATMMLRNSRRLLNLVDQLLELAKFDSGKMKLQASQQNIVSFVKNIVFLFESLAIQNKVNLTFQSDLDDIPLFFDAEKLERVITNIVSNAFNYTPPGGEIVVSTRMVMGTTYPAGFIEIVVRDTGSGIPANQLPHIFDRFYRGESSHEYTRKGTGLGLALSRDLVELHHGQIEVQSNYLPDQAGGTLFILRLPMGETHLQPEEILRSSENHTTKAPTFYIPVRESLTHRRDIQEDLEGDPDETHHETNHKQPPGQPLNPIVLVVDDNADLRTYIRNALEPHFRIREAADGKAGIRLAGQIIPDLVISDILMPEADGYELCAHLKKDIKTSHIPVILLTARASEKSMMEGLETGADDYIVKPFSVPLLEVRVRNLIRLRRQLQRKIQQDMLLQPGGISVSSLDKEFLKELQAILEKNLIDPEFNVQLLAKKLCISYSSLRRKVEALTGETASSLIRSFRLMRAAQLLKSNFGNVTEVAFAVGFSDASYFAKCFKEKFHQSPHEYNG